MATASSTTSIIAACEDKLAAIPVSERMFLRAESVADVAAWLA